MAENPYGDAEDVRETSPDLHDELEKLVVSHGKDLQSIIQKLKDEKRQLREQKDAEIQKLKDEVRQLRSQQERDPKTRDSSLKLTASPSTIPPNGQGSKKTKPPSALVRGMEQKETLTAFIDRRLRPGQEFTKRCKEIVDCLTRLLNSKSSPFKIKRVIKGGSLGKATAVRGKSDIDLVIYMNGYTSVQGLQNDMPAILSKLKEYIETDAVWAQNLMYKDKTKFSLQFYLKMQQEDEEHEVDLLPALDITEFKKKEDLVSIYKEMEPLSEDQRGAYSACLSPLQVKFVSQLPSKIKDFIMLLKHWAKDEDVPVRSYFLELLVVYQWRLEEKQGNTPSKFDHRDCFQRILQWLADCESFQIVFDDNYDVSQHREMAKIKRPYMLDPANPFRNVAPFSKREKDMVRRLAHVALERF